MNMILRTGAKYHLVASVNPARYGFYFLLHIPEAYLQSFKKLIINFFVKAKK